MNVWEPNFSRLDLSNSFDLGWRTDDGDLIEITMLAIGIEALPAELLTEIFEWIARDPINTPSRLLPYAQVSKPFNVAIQSVIFKTKMQQHHISSLSRLRPQELHKVRIATLGPIEKKNQEKRINVRGKVPILRCIIKIFLYHGPKCRRDVGCTGADEMVGECDECDGAQWRTICANIALL